MKNQTTLLISRSCIVLFLCLMLCIGCKSPSDKGSDASPQDSPQSIEDQEDNQEETVSQEFLDLEAEYAEMLAPISNLKTTDSKTYWFIVSWLKTAYKTPDWTGYYSEEWMATAKQNGVDCSGFSRVMLDQIFDKEVSGGSQRLLDHHCTPTGLESLAKGDLVFFRAPYSTTNKIVHVGVYLQDQYFVHATSTKSAAEGLGLSVNSLEEENWAKEFVSGGKVKS